MTGTAVLVHDGRDVPIERNRRGNWQSEHWQIKPTRSAADSVHHVRHGQDMGRPTITEPPRPFSGLQSDRHDTDYAAQCRGTDNKSCTRDLGRYPVGGSPAVPESLAPTARHCGTSDLSLESSRPRSHPSLAASPLQCHTNAE